MADTSKKDPNSWNPVDTTKINETLLKGSGYKTFSYPEELGNERYPYYMMFFVNATGKSALANDPTATISNAEQAAQNNRVGQATTNNIQVGTANIVSNIKKWEDTTDNFVIKKIGQIGVEGVTQLKEFIRQNKRLNIALALPIPNNVTHNQDASYSLSSGGVLGSVLSDIASGEGLGKLAKQYTAQTAPNAILNGASAVVKGVTGGIVDFGSTGENFDSLKMKLLGVAQNERKEQTFQSMQPRKFSFSWLLIPKNENESNSIKDIIKWFKYNQYPEVDTTSGGLNVIIPNEFDIEFHYANKQMDSLAKISTCVLEGVTVDYTPIGKWVAYDGTGNPVATQLTLNFAEIEPLVRSMIARGY